MPDSSPILGLPLIMPAQAQKHVTHNEALRVLDVAVQLAVTNRTRTTVPGTPVVGDRYIVAAAPTGVWAGKAGQVAVFTADGWEYVTPLAGWRAHILAEGQTAVFNGAVWEVPGAGPLAPSLLGVNATANATNRLAVSSPATLLSHEGNGHQLKINKAAAANSASLLFQTGFSGRAEMGTTGSDGFAIKVSADGLSFAEAFSAAGPSGHVSLPAGVIASGFVLRDGTDTTKTAEFALAGIAAGTLRTFTLPNQSGEVAVLAGAQTFAGAKTFSGGLTATGAVTSGGGMTVSGPLASDGGMTVSGALNASGAVTASGPFQVTGTSGTLGTATAAASYGVGTGATVSGATKAVEIGTAGAAGSTTMITLGSAATGALGTTTLHTPAVTFGPMVTSVKMDAAALTTASLGIQAVPNATTRLSVSSLATLLSHEGAGHQVRVNKVGAVDSASLAFMAGLTNRCEIGLMGSNSFSMRVSADGTTFQTMLTAAPATGQVTLHQPLVLEGQTADPASPANGAVWLNATTGQMKARVAGVTRVIDRDAGVPYLVPVAGDYVLLGAGSGGGALTTAIGAAGRFDLYPFKPGLDTVVDRLAVNVTTAVAASLGKIAVYASDINGRPDALIVETADLDFATAGVKNASVSLTLRQGVTYWLGLRHSSTATQSVFPATATPDLNGGQPVTTARKIYRRTLAYATAAPATWGYLASEINASNATAMWARVL